MAQNEMKAKPALPERVRSMEGLGLACGWSTASQAGEATAFGIVQMHVAHTLVGEMPFDLAGHGTAFADLGIDHHVLVVVGAQ